MKNKVIDLFAGCGGFSTGFQQSGYKITKAVEIDKQIAETYSKNHQGTIVFNKDIGDIDNATFFKQEEADVIIGGPPCQGFSMAGSRIRTHSFIDDPRNYLFRHYVNIVKLVKPKVFLFENVKGIISMKEGKIFEEIISTLSKKENFEGIQYFLNYKILNCTEFGIPEKRERVIIIGSQKKVDLEEIESIARQKILNNYPHFFDKVVIKDALEGLPEPNSSGIFLGNKYLNHYQEYLKGTFGNIYNHIATKHTTLALHRMNQIKSGQNYTVLNEHIKSVHSGAYGRMNMNEPSVTITTRFDTPSGGRFIHPTKNRTITAREAARIQSFPDDFIFYGSKSSICKQIGNAVPPKLAFYLANIVEEILNGR